MPAAPPHPLATLAIGESQYGSSLLPVNGACCVIGATDVAERFGREMSPGLAFGVGFGGVGVALQAGSGRTYRVMAAHRRMLKAIAASVT